MTGKNVRGNGKKQEKTKIPFPQKQKLADKKYREGEML
jgi:hypothetical protein